MEVKAMNSDRGILGRHAPALQVCSSSCLLSICSIPFPVLKTSACTSAKQCRHSNSYLSSPVPFPYHLMSCSTQRVTVFVPNRSLNDKPKVKHEPWVCDRYSPAQPPLLPSSVFPSEEFTCLLLWAGFRAADA